MKTRYIILIILAILLISSLIALVVSGMIKISTNASRAVEWCKSENIDTNDCYPETPQCFYDCQKLGLEYLRLNTHTGAFGGVECYCKINQTSEKIW